MLIGAHESTAGGLYHAFSRGEADGCKALQIFTGFNMRWTERVIEEIEGSLFRSERERLRWPVISHAIYLINLASPSRDLRRRSIDALHLDLLNCETLGIDSLVLHPGSHMGAGAPQGLRHICEALGELHRRTDGFAVRILLENTAGQGNGLGSNFEELAHILDHTPGGDRLGVCIDTCHAWAAGYDLASDDGYDTTMGQLDHLVGLERILAFHLNDSKKGRRSKVDRHASIGEGTLGQLAFRRLVNDSRFEHTPAAVETPADADGNSSFKRNIALLKSFRG